MRWYFYAVLAAATLAAPLSAQTYDIDIDAGQRDVTLVVGDAVHLHSHVTGTASASYNCGPYGWPFTVHDGDDFWFGAWQTGVFNLTVTGDDGSVIAAGSATVVSVAFPSAMPVEVGYAVRDEYVVTPQGAPVAVSAADGWRLSVTTERQDDGRTFMTVQPSVRGPTDVIATIVDPDGATREVSRGRVDAFELERVDAGNASFDGFGGGFLDGHAQIVLRPLISDLRLTFAMFAHNATFAGGNTSFSVVTDGSASSIGEPGFAAETDPNTGEAIGRFTYLVQVPIPANDIPSGPQLYCHTITKTLP